MTADLSHRLAAALNSPWFYRPGQSAEESGESGDAYLRLEDEATRALAWDDLSAESRVLVERLEVWNREHCGW
jgi:hypothetical protein